MVSLCKQQRRKSAKDEENDVVQMVFETQETKIFFKSRKSLLVAIDLFHKMLRPWSKHSDSRELRRRIWKRTKADHFRKEATTPSGLPFADGEGTKKEDRISQYAHT